MEFPPDKAVVSIETIVESPFNPRRIDAKTLDKLSKSIQEFGYVDLLIVNKRNMQVVGGNQRLKALKGLGFTEVEVVLVDLDDHKEKALNVALNKISGEWDFDKLRDIMLDIGDEDKELTGFDTSEIDIMISGIGGGMGDFNGSEGGSSGSGEGEGSAGGGDSSGSHESGAVPQNIVIYVPFKTVEAANGWLEINGHEVRVKPGQKTVILKIQE